MTFQAQQQAIRWQVTFYPGQKDSLQKHIFFFFSRKLFLKAYYLQNLDSSWIGGFKRYDVVKGQSGHPMASHILPSIEDTIYRIQSLFLLRKQIFFPESSLEAFCSNYWIRGFKCHDFVQAHSGQSDGKPHCTQPESSFWRLQNVDSSWIGGYKRYDFVQAQSGQSDGQTFYLAQNDTDLVAAPKFCQLPVDSIFLVKNVRFIQRLDTVVLSRSRLDWELWRQIKFFRLSNLVVAYSIRLTPFTFLVGKQSWM